MKIGTIGTGFIVDTFLNATRTNENCDVIACYSRNLEKGEAFAAKHGIAKVYTDMDEMFKDPDIDFIYVASPNSLHYPQSKRALLAGKNVICEKPFTSNIKELEDLTEIAKEKNLFIFEAIIPIHLPNFKWLQNNIDKVGDIKLVQCNFSQYSSRYDAFKRGETPNVFTPEFSGGALMDINIYNIHFVMRLFGNPKSVHYYANVERGIDTSGVLIMQYDHFVATCTGCKDSKSKNLSQIQGDKGYFLIDQESSRCMQVETNVGQLQLHTGLQEIGVGMHYELYDFLDIVARNDYQACLDLLEYSKSVMRVLDAARASSNIVFTADQK